MSELIRHILEDSGAANIEAQAEAVAAARRHARAILDKEGLPTRRKEGWRYMDLSWLSEGDARLTLRGGTAAPEEGEIASLLDEEADRIIFRDGRYMPGLSRIRQDGLEVRGLADVLTSNAELAAELLESSDALDGFAALNAAVAADGAVLRIENDEDPVRLEIHHAGSAGEGAAFCRNRIEIADGGSAEIVERHYGTTGESWTDIATTIDLGAGASLSWARIAESGGDSVRTSRDLVRLGENARFTGLLAVRNAQAARDEIHIRLEGEGASAGLKGLAFPDGKSVADIVTRIDHRVPNCTSDQHFRAVADRGGRAAFQGEIHVAKDAQKTDARQAFDGLLLSRKAEIDAKPELLIYADDVACAHGATIGELDEDALFYLASRGLEPKQARDILTAAFAHRVFQDLGDTPLRDHLMGRLDGWLKQSGGQA